MGSEFGEWGGLKCSHATHPNSHMETLITSALGCEFGDGASVAVIKLIGQLGRLFI